MNLKKNSPVIIIGMHRSGTSLLSRTLEDLGLFMGNKKEENNESLFFLKLNRWMLRSLGATWDNPRSVDILDCGSPIRNLFRDYLELKLKSFESINYLGIKKYFKYRDISKIDEDWGFKDPRSTFTLSIWKEIFPQAKILHIQRHGVDVANSLVKRSTSILNKKQEKFMNKKSVYVYRNKTVRFTDTCFCLDHFRSLKLWDIYMEEAKKQVDKYEDCSMVVKYEDFLIDPKSIITDIVKFIGLDIEDKDVSKYLKGINPSRAFAYKKDVNLVEFSNLHRDLLEKHGY